MSVQSASFRPERKLVLGDYDLDAFAVEYYDDTGQFDFRFELGSGLGIYWALPIERNGRLRLLHVDGAAYTVDEPELIEDPWICDLPRTEWRGDLKTFRDGTQLLGVAIEAKAEPARYRCEIVVRDKAGKERSERFEWPAASADSGDEAKEESAAGLSIRTGDSFLNLGQYDSARTCYLAAVAEASKRGTAGQMDYTSLGTAMNAIGHCYFREGRFEEAREWYVRAADAKEIADPPIDHESLSNTLHHVGSCLSSLRKYADAQKYFERAADHAAKGNLQGRVDHESIGGSLNQVGFCLSRMNQFEQARGWYERAVTEKEKGDAEGRVDHDSVAISLNQVGYCLAGLGRFAEAVTWFERAAAAAEKGDVRGNVNRERLATILSLRDQCAEQVKRAKGAAADTDAKR